MFIPLYNKPGDSMNSQFSKICMLSLLVSGCTSSEGTYSPGCIAFEGSSIQLQSGRFAWEKFSDQVLVDDEGNVVNQFPDYPKRGTYRIDGQTVFFATEAGTSMENMFLHRDGDQYLLLTADQLRAWEETGKYADCVLTLERGSAI